MSDWVFDSQFLLSLIIGAGIGWGIGYLLWGRDP